jgi:predicted ABC-type transport system involved in lysophospholipase L1 biosynthesis ATPase subunit
VSGDAPSNHWLFELTGVGKTYGNVTALRDVDLRIAERQYVALTGHSGSGKTTLLHLLAGLHQPTSGQIRFRGQPLTAQRNDTHRGRHVGLVFQAFELLPTLTALENVQVPMLWSVKRVRDRRAKAQRMLEAVGLAHRADHLPGELSGGEQQRVSIARALANDPQVILADEPTGNLDTANAAAILDVLERCWRELQVTLIVVTHESEFALRAQRLVRLLDGRIVSAAATP